MRRAVATLAVTAAMGAHGAFDASTFMRSATQAAQRGEFSLARSYLNTLAPYWNLNDEARSFAYLLRGETFANEQLWVSARKDFARALEFDPDSDAARTALGRIYLYGRGIESDAVLAMSFLAPAAENGSTQAAFHIGYAHLQGIGVEADVDEARRWLLQAAAAEDDAAKASAMAHLATSYRTPFTEPTDTDRAIEWYDRAIALGNAQAMVAKAALLRSNEVPTRQPKAAIALLEDAVGRDSDDARVALGYLYLTGSDLPKDPARAAELIRAAAARGHAPAALQWGHLLQHGIGTQADLDAAMAAYRRAATAGLVPAMHRLGHLLLGTKEANAHRQGLEWLTLAAHNDTADALNQLAWVLATHKSDAVRDGERAVTLARRAVALTRNASYLDTLAAAQAEAGEFDAAVRSQREALALAAEEVDGSDTDLIEELESHLRAYRRSKPWRE
ncbi:MAG: hypothetical protein AAF918_18920 [Pseudomonadota bacterium]